LAQLAAGIGDAQVRNRGTIGGSVANNDPSADYPAGLLGSGATIITDQREIAAEDFFTDLFETDLKEGEMIRAISIPPTSRSAYQKFDNPASRYAIVGVFVSENNGDIKVAVTGAGACVFRSADMEQALSNDFTPGALADINVSSEEFNADLHASAAYRAALVLEMAKRAVAAIE
jgi:carbon-monoxide dehydrogenase medium subunit